jgi:hypothetical protein
MYSPAFTAWLYSGELGASDVLMASRIGPKVARSRPQCPPVVSPERALSRLEG